VGSHAPYFGYNYIRTLHLNCLGHEINNRHEVINTVNADAGPLGTPLSYEGGVTYIDSVASTTYSGWQDCDPGEILTGLTAGYLEAWNNDLYVYSIGGECDLTEEVSTITDLTWPLPDIPAALWMEAEYEFSYAVADEFTAANYEELKAVFNHENCTSCHSIEPDGRPLDPAIYNGYSHTSANCSGQCHTDTLETANAEADDTLVWQKGNLWNGPADCDRMTSLPSFVSGGDPAENLKHHLQQDNLIIWAIMGGDVPFNNRTDNDEIMDVEAWRTLVGKWVDHWKDNDYSCTAAIQNLQ